MQRATQGPSKTITAAVPTADSGTFIAGLSDGRVLTFSGSEYALATGPGHTTLVSALGVSPEGEVFSSGYDDVVREIASDGSSFVYVNNTHFSPKTSVEYRPFAAKHRAQRVPSPDH